MNSACFCFRGPRLLGVGLLCVLIYLSGCGRKSDADAASASAGAGGDAARPVKLMTLGAADRVQTLRFPAVIRAAQSVELSFNQPGDLIELNAQQGMPLKAGALIARLDPRDAAARLETARANHDLAKAEYERYLSLLANEAVSQAAVDQRAASLRTAQAQLEEARKRVDDTRMVAPFDGMVARRYVENRTSVQAKQPIVLFESLRDLEAVIDLSETMMLSARREAEPPRGILIFEARPEVEIPVTFKEIATSADPLTQTYQAVFGLQSTNGITILPGMSASLLFRPASEADDGHYVVPPLAVVGEGEGAPFVYVYDEAAGRVTRRAVTVGPMRSDGIEVLAGLQAGDRIAVAGVNQLRDGMAVRPLEQ